MMRAMWSAAAGMSVQQMNMDTISNNLANVNTSGYKKARAEFQDLLYQTVNLAGTSSSTSTNLPSGIQLGHGAKLQAVTHQYSQGSFRQCWRAWSSSRSTTGGVNSGHEVSGGPSRGTAAPTLGMTGWTTKRFWCSRRQASPAERRARR
jgi:hypothetical protein